MSAPVANLSDASVLNNTIVTWTQGSAPDTNQIWRSINGAAFTLIGTVAGGVTTFTDTGVMAGGDLWTYKVRGVKSGTFGTFSNTVSSGNNLNYSAQTNASFPDLVLCYQSFKGNVSASLVSLSAPLLRRIFGNFFIDSCANLVSVSVPSLTAIDVDFDASGDAALTSLSLPSLVSSGFNGGGGYFGAGTSGGGGGTSPNLATFSIPLFAHIFLAAGLVDFHGCALNATSVNLILSRLVVTGCTGNQIDLSAGTNAAPSGQGVADKATLIGRGNVVTTN